MFSCDKKHTCVVAQANEQRHACRPSNPVTITQVATAAYHWRPLSGRSVATSFFQWLKDQTDVRRATRFRRRFSFLTPARWWSGARMKATEPLLERRRARGKPRVRLVFLPTTCLLTWHMKGCRRRNRQILCLHTPACTDNTLKHTYTYTAAAGVSAKSTRGPPPCACSCRRGEL